MYLVHPSWALPIPVTARGLLFFGLIILFFILSLIMNRLFASLAIDKPVIIYPENFSKHIKDNAWLLIICLVAVIFHSAPLSSPIYLVGDEAIYLQNGLWIYDYFGAFWHQSAKYAFWIGIVLTVTVYRKKFTCGFDERPSDCNLGILTKSFYILSGLCLLVLYFILIRDLPFNITIVRDPPLQKFLYMLSYFVLGINYIGPRLCQLLFYILSAIYLYRTINLLSDKKTALLGASIYLFSPIIFDYAHFAELHSGVIFFIIIISYYFLKYLYYQDNRDLLLSSYFLGTGFLYKRDIFLMFFICSAYLVFYRVKNRELHLTRRPLEILSLNLFPIIPWLIIGKFFNWRNAWISLSRFASLDNVTAYLLSIPAQLSWIIFFLFALSICYVLILKRNLLSFYWGFLFLSFYFFYTSQDIPFLAHRFSMAFYPTIAVFTALFLSSLEHKIKWKHTFKMVFTVLTIYLIFLCTVPSFSDRFITYRDVKAQYFPGDRAMQWVRDNIKDGEKILSFRFKPDLFYRDKYRIDKDKIISYWYGVDDMEKNLLPEELKAFCIDNKISYILFPYGLQFIDNPFISYLKENKNNEFIEAAKYNIDENYIYIYRIKKIY